jgi:hypothetical protein
MTKLYDPSTMKVFIAGREMKGQPFMDGITEFRPGTPEERADQEKTRATAEKEFEEALDGMDQDAGGLPWDWTLQELRNHLNQCGMDPMGSHEMPGHLWERLESIERGIDRIRQARMEYQAAQAGIFDGLGELVPASPANIEEATDAVPPR